MISWLTVAIVPVRHTKNRNAQIGKASQEWTRNQMRDREALDVNGRAFASQESLDMALA